MDQLHGRPYLHLSLGLALALGLGACSDDGGNEGGEDQSTSETATSGDGDGDNEESGTNDQGDGDGDPGDGDGDPGDGDGDPGDGDGDPGDGDPGDGDGDPILDMGDNPCQEFSGDIAPIPPDVMLLLDRSGSMMETMFDINDPNKTRWQALYEAVEAILVNADEIAFGAKTFSTQGWGACGVSPTADVDIMLNNANGLLNAIPGPMDVVDGGTPTNLAIETTMQIMDMHQSLGGDKIIFLITDGRIGCANDDDQALMDAVTVLEDGYMNLGITTYVVGIAPSQFGPILVQLEEMAIAGGAPKMGLEPFYRADDADALAVALDEVLQDSYGKSCLMNLDEAPFFPEYTQVVIGNTSYELVSDCDTEDGFIYTDMTYTQIEVCGQACVDLGIEQSAEVQFYCNPN